MTVKGTAPLGVEDDVLAARWVRKMFGRIAPRYDLANHLLSFNIDRGWRNRTVDRVRDVLLRPQACVLDLCCGTGDLTLALALARGPVADGPVPGCPVLGSDFCHPMLTAAVRKVPVPFFEADALALPVADASLDLLTCAFGFRNLADYDAGLREFARVLKPGGRAAILEFSHPPNRLVRRLYGFYAGHVLPRLGGWISGARDAYTYLPESVRRFPDAPELAARMRHAGFTQVTFERMTLGVVALHLGVK